MMKRNPKPFSVEIKKSRVQGQRDQLTPRRLFELPPARAAMIFQKDGPQAVAKPSAAGRILPSIVEPVWSNSEPIEPVRRKRSSAETTRGRGKINRNAGASEDKEDGRAEVPVVAKEVPRALGAPDAENALPADDVEPAKGEWRRVRSSKPRKKALGAVEQERASKPTADAELTASAASTKAPQRRLTKRLAAVAQLSRHERWKGRLHPAAW